jgi:multidrug efflux pump subunit AcrA (membrane-fusion protein)
MPPRFPTTRKDLAYHERQIDGATVVFVSDPVRGVFYRYNVLQAAMLRSLDGVRSCDEIVEALSLEFEVEIPREAVDQFIASAKERLLLDIASYGGVMPRKARRELARGLRRAGFRLHELARTAGDQPLASRPAILLAEALEHLRRDDPAAAMTALTALRELDPSNARAAELVAILQTAHVRAAGGMTDWPTFPVFNPTRLLQVLDATLGRLLFSSLGVLAMIALVLLGVFCGVTTSFADLEIGPLDIAVAIVMYVVLGFLHELGHALACFHYGGPVTEVGVQLMYYLNFVFYCDTSSSYLFERRRDKMIVQLAGTISTLLCCSGLAIILAVLHPDVTIYPGFALTLLFASAIVLVNLIPFVKLDGYYLLCDLLRQINLRDRSFQFARGWLRHHLLGLPPLDGEQPSPRDRKLFLVFACLAFVFTTLFLYSLYFRALAPIVEHGGAGGLVLVLAVTVVLIRKTFLRPIWSLLRLIVRERRRIFTRHRSLALLAAATVLIAPWFLITWPVIVDAELVLVPVQRVDVRAQTPGLVDQILVAEGDLVAAGQPLARLRNDELAARRVLLEADLDIADRRLAQLRAGPRAEDLGVLQRRLHVARARQRRDQQQADLARALDEAGLGTAAQASAGARVAAVTRADADVASHTLDLVEAGTRPEQIAATEAERTRLAVAVEALRVEEDLLTLRSPARGVVATKHLGDRLQMMMQPGDRFAEIHDLDAFTAEIRLPTWAPLQEYKIGDAIALRPHGTPHQDLRATIARIRDAADRDDTAATDQDARLVLTTSPFAVAHGRAGMTGHARLYGKRRSLAYTACYLPLQRLFRIRLWSL